MEQTDVALLIRLSAYRKHIGVPYSQLQIIQRNEHCKPTKLIIYIIAMCEFLNANSHSHIQLPARHTRWCK